jgi:hypothetical protein
MGKVRREIREILKMLCIYKKLEVVKGSAYTNPH